MNIFITGNPGCGKSTLVKKLLGTLHDKKISGIVTPEIRERGSRRGFKIIDLASGMEEIMASVNIEHGPMVSRYKVNVEGIDRIMDKFLESYEDSDYVVIDEIGSMEFFSEKFKKVMTTVLKSDKPVIATLSKKFVEKYEKAGKVYHLTRDNFDKVFSELLSLISNQVIRRSDFQKKFYLC